MPPLISVYMPTHNRVQLLKRAVASVLSQSYKNIELLIVNDSSTDGTKAYLEQLAKGNEKIRVFHMAEPEGACFARNIAIEAARGEFITGLDDDDEFLPERLQSLFDAWQEGYSFITSNFYWDFGPSRKLVATKAMDIYLEDMLSHKYGTNQAFTRTSYLKDIGMFDVNMPASQDWDIWIRLLIAKGRAKKIAKPTYVIHTAHDSPRISISEKKVEGFQMLMRKFDHCMTKKNRKDMAVLLAVMQQRTLTLPECLTKLSLYTLPYYTRFWIKKNLPIFARVYRKLTGRA
ncbi:MAG: glycosyltransferase [Aestuariibacter sp.]